MVFRPVRMVFGIAIAGFFAVPSALVAQDLKPQFHESPFAVLINRVNQKDVVTYVRGLARELKIGTAAIEAYDSSGMNENESKLERPVSGTLFFLAKAMIPNVAAVQFTEVKDEADYERLVRLAGKQMLGESGKPEGSNGKHKIVTSFTNRTPVAEAEEEAVEVKGSLTIGSDSSDEAPAEEQPRNAIKISIGTPEGSSIEVQSLESNGEVVEENGEKFVESTSSWEQYYRYHGTLMYQGDNETVWDLPLPTRDGVLKDASTSVDMGAEVYIDRIPMGLKTLGWNMLYGGLSTQLQQRDGEPDVEYNFRSSGGQLAFAIAKAGMFDADHVNGFIEFARNEQPIRAELSVSARKGSDLSRRLEEFSSARSRFAPILNDNAAMTLHMAVKLPEECVDVFKSGAELLKSKLIEDAGTDVDLVLSGAEIAETLGQIADHTNLEMFLKLGWTESSGGVIYGGMQVDDNPELLRSVLTLITPESAPQDYVDLFELTKKGDMEVIEFLIPRDEDIPFQLSHLYITHANSCLWFCIGGENSHDILRQSIERCQNVGLRANTRVFSAELDLEKWLAYPADEPSGLARIPRMLDSGLAGEIESEVGNAGSDGDDKKDVAGGLTDIMQKVIELGGRQDIQVHVDSSKAGLKVHADVGKAFGNYIVARWLQAADLALSNMQEDMLAPPPAVEAAPDTNE